MYLIPGGNDERNPACKECKTSCDM